MEYPSTWKSDRKTRRGGGFQALPKATPRRTPAKSVMRTTPLRGSFKETSTLGRYFKYGVRVLPRAIPGVGIGLLALEIGWYFYQRSMNSELEQGYDMPGWTGPINCSGSPQPWQHEGFRGCIGPFAFTNDTQPWGQEVSPGTVDLHLMKSQFSARTNRRWERDGSTNNLPQIPGPLPRYVPISPINPLAPFDPINLPLEPVPQVHPDPVPFTPNGKIPVFRDWRSPTEGKQEGEPSRRPRSRFKRPPKPYQRPATVTTIRPAGQPVTSSPGNHNRVPPRRNEKEKKIRAKTGSALRIIMKILNQATEMVDYLNAFYQSLPAEVRKANRVSRTDPIEMFKVVYRHMDQLVVSDVFINLLLNEIEDWVYGRFGAASKFVAQELNLSVGPQFGQGYLRAQARIAAKYVKENMELTK